ncbi:MAG TPA: hypothetical protein VGO03_18015 [Acidimicrobiia bacterium]|jgi:hypothetical protein
MQSLITLQLWCAAKAQRLERRTPRGDQRGMATAELLGNAALGIAALVVIWGALQALGLNIVSWITSKVIG